MIFAAICEVVTPESKHTWTKCDPGCDEQKWQKPGVFSYLDVSKMI